MCGLITILRQRGGQSWGRTQTQAGQSRCTVHVTVTAHGPGWAGLSKPEQEEAEKIFGNNIKVLKPPATGAPEVCQSRAQSPTPSFCVRR